MCGKLFLPSNLPVHELILVLVGSGQLPVDTFPGKVGQLYSGSFYSKTFFKETNFACICINVNVSDLSLFFAARLK